MRVPVILALALTTWLASFPAVAETLKLKLTEIAVVPDASSGKPVLNIRLAEDTAAAMGAFTAARIGEQIDVRVGAEVLTSPIVRDAILGGALQISGDFTQAEAEALATLLRSGAASIEVDGKDK